MAGIRPRVSTEVICAEPPAVPCGVMLFGASGDLTRRKVLESLFELFRKGLLHESFWLLGCARTAMTDEEFRNLGIKAAMQAGSGAGSRSVEAFAGRLYYQNGDYSNAGFYQKLAGRRSELDKKYGTGGNCIFYLAVPPTVYESVVDGLDTGRAAAGGDGRLRLVVEKPFGRDLASAAALDKLLASRFGESQIFRIDHYHGKETVQNILMFRFANSIFEPVWNRDHIDHVQITIAESDGIGHRAGYYDQSGALRDMVQNHLLQVLTLVAMEPPASFDAESIRDERGKLMKSLRPIDGDSAAEFFVRGQYAGYRNEKGVAKDSQTETFAAAKLFVDNWRWRGVPFYVRTGKRLARRVTEIAIEFRPVPHSMFASFGLEEMPPNVLVFKIQPEEGISLSLQAKRPGSKVCMGTLAMDMSYKEVFGGEPPEAYQRLLLDCMAGDQTLFVRRDASEAAWALLMPVLELWERGGSGLHVYPDGSESFAAADELMARDGRRWRGL
ncbi:MAG TPA: glucose-6-phosphate dehydrogenase [Sedimentisphaerales bacterium]|nr:glucose-6-phosphate dehydrogenase [Sedimentisphaerales bacterium]